MKAIILQLLVSLGMARQTGARALCLSTGF